MKNNSNVWRQMKHLIQIKIKSITQGWWGSQTQEIRGVSLSMGRVWPPWHSPESWGSLWAAPELWHQPCPAQVGSLCPRADTALGDTWRFVLSSWLFPEIGANIYPCWLSECSWEMLNICRSPGQGFVPLLQVHPPLLLLPWSSGAPSDTSSLTLSHL